MSVTERNSQTPTDQQETQTSPNGQNQLTSTTLANYTRTHGTPAMVREERIKRFISDKDTYARSVTPNNEGGTKDGKTRS